MPGDPSKPFEPEALRRAATTWSGQWWKAGGGASPWDPIVYDPTLDLIYVGTANANPWYPELRGDKEGDNLYASSIVAIKASTGEIVWHYQTTPGDSWDYDATQPITLADLTIDGRPRKVLMQPNKNAFLYVLDRENGKLISATPYASMTWATGIDSSGRPIVNPAAKPSTAGVLVSPADYGAHNWNPTSFSPTTGLLYLSVTDGGILLHVVDPKFKLNPNDRTMGIDPRYAGPLKAKRDSAPPAKGRLVAWNPVTKREAWRVEHPGLRSGGTLSTAGNIVFQGRGDGIFAAYRATDGKMLWKFDAQVGIAAAPMTYAIDGVQYVAILAAPPGYSVDPKIRTGPGRLLVFALDGKATLAPSTVPRRVTDPVADVRRERDGSGGDGRRRPLFPVLPALPQPRLQLREERRDPGPPAHERGDARDVRADRPRRREAHARHAVVRERHLERSGPVDPGVRAGAGAAGERIEQVVGDEVIDVAVRPV